MFTRTCRHCQKVFESRNRISICCSRKCSDRSRVSKIQPKQCALCNESFTPERKSVKYCSATCVYKARERPHTRRCDQCDCVFTSKRSQVRFCSRKCTFASRVTIKQRPCPICMKVFRPVAMKITYCSVECSHASKRIDGRLRKAQNWKAQLGKLETLSKEKLQDVRNP